jgi:hypothetical protein
MMNRIALRSFYSISTLKIQIHVGYSTLWYELLRLPEPPLLYLDDLPRRPVITMTIISEEELLRERLNGLIR